MLSKFWETFAGKAAEQWLTRLLTPALVFWLVGLSAWLWSRPASFASALDEFGQWITALPVARQLSLLVAALFVVTLSAIIADRITPTGLRLLEGYWPRPFDRLFVPWHLYRLGRAQTAAQQHARAKIKAAVSAASGTVDTEGTETRIRQTTKHWLPQPLERLRTEWHAYRNYREEFRARAPVARARRHELQAERTMRAIPIDVDLVMPTRLGNTLRTAESRPRERFGLDAVVCWPYLWLLLDDVTKAEIDRARSVLNTAARSWMWSVALAVWTIWAWWALPVAIVAAVLVYHVSILPTAQMYGQLIEAAFTLNRHRLYEATHRPPPAGPTDERSHGQELTEYLWRGTSPATAAPLNDES